VTTRVETWGGTRVAICRRGALLATAADVGDFLSEAWVHEAVPTARLNPDFFGLRTGLAGEVTPQGVLLAGGGRILVIERDGAAIGDEQRADARHRPL